MIRFSGGTLLLIVCMGLVLAVPVADQADTASEATVSIDYETGQMFVGGEAVADPLTTENGTSMFRVDAYEGPIENAPGNVVDFSLIRVQVTLLKTMLDLAFAIATMSAQFMVASPIPTDWWVNLAQYGGPLAAVGGGAWHVRSVLKEARRH